MLRRLAATSALLALLLSYVSLSESPGASAAPAAAADTDTGLPVRTAQEVAAMWRVLMNPSSDIDNPYLQTPSVTPPYEAGALRPDYIQDGINAVNFYRYISGLPYDVTATEALNRQAQYGSLLLAAGENFGHTPPQPAGMSDDLYKLGYDSTSSANIFASYGYHNHVLVHSVQSYMDDSDVSNLALLGHRRWILNPPLKYTGMGMVKGVNDFSYTAMQVFDESRTEPVRYHYIPYPARGAFPVEVFSSATAWSVGINPDEYALPDPQKVKVLLIRERDNRVWQLDAGKSSVTENGAYFGVENSRYGTGSAIIFRPDGVDAYAPGDVYRVRIEGLTGTDGSVKTIEYAVHFMSVNNPAGSIPAFTDTAKHWAKRTIDWAAGLGIASGYGDGTFRPERTVTEAEFVKMFAVGVGAKVGVSDPWYNAYYDFAFEHGFALKGMKDDKVRNLPINRLAVAELLASAAGKPLTGNAAISFLLDRGYSKGKTAPTVQGYKGADLLTRAEAVQFIKNALDAKFTLAS